MKTQSAAAVVPPTGSPKPARVVAVAIFFHWSWSFSLPAFFSFDWSCACAATRHAGFGALPQRVQRPPTSCAEPAHDAHWFAAGPVQVRHEGSHVVHTVSVVVVQAAVSDWPDAHVAQASHEV